MKTVRLQEPLEVRLQQAARLTGKKESQIIREALETHCARLLAHHPSHQMAALIGVVDSSARPELSSLAEQTGEAFGDLLLKSHLRQSSSHDAD